MHAGKAPESTLPLLSEHAPMQTADVSQHTEASPGEAPAEQVPPPGSPPPSRRRGRRGVTTMEYLVMLSFILLVVIVGVQTFGSHVAGLFKTSKMNDNIT